MVLIYSGDNKLLLCYILVMHYLNYKFISTFNSQMTYIIHNTMMKVASWIHKLWVFFFIIAD